MAKPTKGDLKKDLKKLGLIEGTDYPKTLTNEKLEALLKKETLKAKKNEAPEEEETEEETPEVEGGGELEEPETEEEDEEEETEEDEEEEEETEEEEEEEEETFGPQIAKKKLSYSGKGDIDIVKGNRYIRNYNADVHGKDFIKLAKGFIRKNTDPKSKKTPFLMVNCEKIKQVRVEFTEITKKGETSKVNKKFGASIQAKERALQLASDRCVSVIF